MELDYNLEDNKIIRKANLFGNGAHVLVPKNWACEEIILINPKKQNLYNKVIKALSPNFDKIISVILYGSYARKEEEIDSDIDILVIANEKFKIKKSDFDIKVIDINDFNTALKLNPVLIYSAINEGVALFNSECLNKLKKNKLEKSNFKYFIRDSIESLKSDKIILSLDKETGDYASNSIIYSIILRLRGIFIIKCLISQCKYSNKNFKNFLKEKIPEIDIKKTFLIFNQIKKDEDSNYLIDIHIAEKLINLLETEIKHVRSDLN